MTDAPTIEVSVSAQPIDPAAFVAGAAPPSGHGAQILFFGVVRQQNLGRQVVSVSYDAFPPLAERVLSEICAEARAQWGEDLSFRLAHRMGRLGVGEVSLAVAVTSRHRDEAYRASRFVIEELKHRAPVWKKETYEDGESEWLKGHALCGHAGDDASPRSQAAMPASSSITSK